MAQDLNFSGIAAIYGHSPPLDFAEKKRLPLGNFPARESPDLRFLPFSREGASPFLPFEAQVLFSGSA